MEDARHTVWQRLAHKALPSAGRAYVRYAPVGVGKHRLVRPTNQALKNEAKCFVTRVPGVGRMEGRTDDLIQRYLYLFGVWEPHLSSWLSNRLRPGDVFVDVGSNIGYYALLASRLVGPTGRVVAIEASPVIYDKLRDNLLRNKARNVRALNMAVTDERSIVPVFEASNRNTGKTTILAEDRLVSRYTVPGDPLVEILEPEEVAMARVIKIDVEGAEAKVVAGLLPALSALRKDAELAIEVNAKHLARQGLTEAAVLEPLTAAGFVPFQVRNSYKATSYLMPPVWPRPWKGPLRGETQLVFSRAGS